MNVESSPPTGTVRCCSDDVMCVLNPTQARRDAPERVAGCDRCRVHLLYRRLRRCVLVVTVEGDSSRRHRCALCWLCNSSGAYRLGLPVSCWAELLVPSSKCVSPCVMVYVRACPSKWPAVCVYGRQFVMTGVVLATWQCYDSDGEFCAPLYQLRQLLVACLAVLVTQVVLTSLYFTLAPRGRLFLAVLMASAQEATAFTTKVRTLKVLGLGCVLSLHPLADVACVPCVDGAVCVQVEALQQTAVSLLVAKSSQEVGTQTGGGLHRGFDAVMGV